MEVNLFLGCSRGLGRAVCQTLDAQKGDQSFVLVSRSQGALESLAHELGGPCEVLPGDLASPEKRAQLFAKLQGRNFHRVFYVAGGGPYGPYLEKQWKDHRWALEVTLLGPMEAFKTLAGESQGERPQQWVFVGSQIADFQADPQASSYAAAKWGLRGWFETLVEEAPELDLRLFRPGYMDTALLPPGAQPRAQGKDLLKPQQAADQLVRWILDPEGEKIMEAL